MIIADTVSLLAEVIIVSLLLQFLPFKQSDSSGRRKEAIVLISVRLEFSTTSPIPIIGHIILQLSMNFHAAFHKHLSSLLCANTSLKDGNRP